ncbi:MAG: hypothetical protein ABJ370_05115 [Paracoccaceae bacterium]
MFERFRKKLKSVVKGMWCHRIAYAGLAMAYGAACVGILDKDTLTQVVTGLYVAMTAQRH